MEEAVGRIQEVVTAISEFLAANGYPQPAYHGADEAKGEKLRRLKPGYQAVTDAGGLVAAACSSAYFNEVGTGLSLPIVIGGAMNNVAELGIRASQAAGYECWIYNCPGTDQAASPAVYRRRYGLAMWRNGEDGAMPWEFSGVPWDENSQSYMEKPEGRLIYAMACPTWEGTPIDTVIYEAYREGIYDTRYLATLEKYLKLAKEKRRAPAVVKKVQAWLDTFSVNDDLQQVRGQMVRWTLRLRAALNR